MKKWVETGAVMVSLCACQQKWCQICSYCNMNACQEHLMFDAVRLLKNHHEFCEWMEKRVTSPNDMTVNDIKTKMKEMGYDIYE